MFCVRFYRLLKKRALMAKSIDQYESSSDSEEENESSTSEVVQKKANRKRTWEMDSVYESKEKAIASVKEGNIWSFHFSNTTSEGSKSYYRCNRVKKKGEQCAAGLYLFYPKNSSKVFLFRAAADHSHDNLHSLSNKLSEKMKMETRKLVELHVKPKKIFEILTEKGLQPKNKAQLSNYLVKLRKELFGPSAISLGQLEQWCIDHSLLPESDDAAFVVSYTVGYEDEELEDDEDEDENENRGPYFRIFVSTKRLLKSASISKKIHSDATYKLVWEGFPILVVGTTDMDRHFHPFGLAACSNEKTGDFIFIFEALVSGVNYLNEEINPDCLISDASEAIRNAFQHVFGAEKRLLMCWAHVRRNVVKKVESLADKENKEQIMEDIDTLQLCSSEEIFDKAVNNFMKKWKNKKENKFVDYMVSGWFGAYRYWFEGAADLTPSTNNALEAFNLVIKREETFRERLPLPRFLETSLKSVERWSKEYENNSRIFHTVRSLHLKDWTQAYNWARTKIPVTSVPKDDSFERYYVPSEKEKGITQADIDNVIFLRWNTFDQFKKRAFKVYLVDLPKDGAKWTEGTCTCPSFMKRFLCKHVMGLAIRLKYAKPPPSAKNIPLGEKRKRGRPKKATRALLVD